jgi:MFS family permease
MVARSVRMNADGPVRTLSTTMYAPAAKSLGDEFHVANKVVIALTVTISLLGASLGPLVFAPLSEVYGRLPIYLICNAIYLGFMIGLACSTNVSMFLIFRFITGCVASSFMTCGGATIADLYPLEERGRVAALFSIGPQLSFVSSDEIPTSSRPTY